MVDQSLFLELRQQTETIHHRTLNHKTVLGIGAGTLPEETFRYYIEQDYQFLRRYVQVLALATAASNGLLAMARLADLLHNTLDVEIDALRTLYERFGGVVASLDDVPRSPTCAAYTNHLLAVAAERNLLLTLAAILPCQWGYLEIGRSLEQLGLPADERYAAWIEEYAGDEYGVIVEWVIDHFDHLALDAGASVKARAAEVFVLSAKYEHRFWEMAWNREQG
ncbi:MAG: thiaminase II [Chloroflexia bacterium]|nr:thiaminase II [Chloroflexia bacterium]